MNTGQKIALEVTQFQFERGEACESLLGEILATLRVNFDRKDLRTANDTIFLTLLEGWEKRYKDLNPPEAATATPVCVPALNWIKAEIDGPFASHYKARSLDGKWNYAIWFSMRDQVWHGTVPPFGDAPATTRDFLSASLAMRYAEDHNQAVGRASL